MRLRARRVGAIATNATNNGALVDQAVAAKLRGLADSYRTAQTAAALAAKQFKEGENLLPGTGGEVWRELFDAARKFAVESYPACVAMANKNARILWAVMTLLSSVNRSPRRPASVWIWVARPVFAPR